MSQPALQPRGVRLALVDTDRPVPDDDLDVFLAALDAAQVPMALCSTGTAADVAPLAEKYPRVGHLIVDGGATVLRRGAPDWTDLEPPSAIARQDDEQDAPSGPAGLEPDCLGGSRLVQHLGLDWSDVLAIGDNTLDLGMLGLAGLAVCLAPLSASELAPATRGQVRITCVDRREALTALQAMEPSPLG